MVAPVVLLLRKLRWENRLSSQVQDQPMQQSKTSSQIKKGLSVRAVCPTCQQWHWNKSPAIISSNQTDPFITFNSSPCLEGSCLPNRATLAGYFPCWQLPWTGFPSQPTVVADLTPVFSREPSGTGPAPPQEEPSSPRALRPLLQASSPSPYIPGCSLSQLQTVFTTVHAGRRLSSSLRNLFLHSAIHPFHNYAKRRTRVFLTERDRVNIGIKGH